MTLTAPVSPRSLVTLRRAAWITCALLVLVASRGVWPIVPVEGDDQGVILGVEGMVTSSPALLARRYLFEIQPGSYELLATAVRMTGLSAQNAFAIATVSGAALFAVSGAWLLSTALALPFVYALLAMLACQETIAAACYLNTSALAGGLALLALVPFARGSRLPLLLLGGVGLGVAGWLRADALLSAPAALALLAARDGFNLQTLRATALAAIAALLVFVALRQASGAPLSAAFAAYASVPADTGTMRTSRDAVVTLLSPALLLLASVGTLWLCLRKNWPILAVFLTGVVPTALAYGHALATTKYLYFTIPFALMPALSLLRSLLAGRRLGALTAFTILATADAVAGIRVLPPDACFFQPAPAVGSVTLPIGSRSLAAAIGGGDVIANEDGFRLRTGQLFAAETWHREKLRQRARLAVIRSVLENTPDETIYFAGWLPEQLALRELFAAGFRPQSVADFGSWHRGTQTIELRFLGHVGSPYQPAGPAAAPQLDHNPLLIGSYGGKVRPTELADGRCWQAVSAPREGFVTLYRRAPQP